MPLTPEAAAPQEPASVSVRVSTRVHKAFYLPRNRQSPPSYQQPPQGKMPGLDAVRGLAIVMVVCYHGFAIDLPNAQALSHGARLLRAFNADLWLGVNLFFVLSGFLITGILLDTKHRAAYYKAFYLRRLLRIVPVYVAVLFVAKAQLGLGSTYVLMCLFYAANLTTFFRNIGPTYGPLWSLAVEEQFYLLWPLVIRRCSNRCFGWVCIGLITCSPLLRGLAHHLWPWLGSPRFTTWLISDNLAWGALLAVALRCVRDTRQLLRAATPILAGAGGLLLASLILLHCFSRWTVVGEALQVVPFLLFFTALLGVALLVGDRPAVVRCTAPLRFLGYISYGLYLVHTLVYYGFDSLLVRLHGPVAVLTTPLLLTRFVFVFVTSVAIAALSRRYYEDPFLRMKERLASY